jgi:hypothetical protein
MTEMERIGEGDELDHAGLDQPRHAVADGRFRDFERFGDGLGGRAGIPVQEVDDADVDFVQSRHPLLLQLRLRIAKP